MLVCGNFVNGFGAWRARFLLTVTWIYSVYLTLTKLGYILEVEDGVGFLTNNIFCATIAHVR